MKEAMEKYGILSSVDLCQLMHTLSECKDDSKQKELDLVCKEYKRRTGVKNAIYQARR